LINKPPIEWNLPPNPFRATKAQLQLYQKSLVQSNQPLVQVPITSIINQEAITVELSDESDELVEPTPMSTEIEDIGGNVMARFDSIAKDIELEEESNDTMTMANNPSEIKSTRKARKGDIIITEHIPNHRYGTRTNTRYHAMTTTTSPLFDPFNVVTVTAFKVYVKQALSAANPNKAAAITAIVKELTQLFKLDVMHTINFTDIPQQYRNQIIQSILFITDKYLADGTFDKTKARLAARGDQQINNLFTDSISSPTVNSLSINVILSVAVKHKCFIKVSDVPGAFLHAQLQDGDNIYMKLPKEAEDIWCTITNQTKADIKHHDRGIYVKLNKALYGLKQSSALWYQVLKTFFESQGFTTSKYDPCVFFKRDNRDFIYCLVHVDDILQVSTSIEMINQFNLELEGEYGKLATKEGQQISLLNMNIQIRYDLGYISVDQNNYVNNLLTEYKIGPSMTSNYPSNDRFFRQSESLSKPIESRRYLSLLMSLMYVAIRTRPDILKEVTFLATHISNPTDDDWNKLLKILYYLNKYPNKSLYFRANQDNQLVIYCDASFGLHDDTAGHTGIIIKLYGNTILIKSLKQKIITKSSTESELVALDESITYVPWITGLLEELTITYSMPIIVFQDNQSTIIMGNTGHGNFRRTKHIKNRYFWVKQFVDDGTITLRYINTNNMLADVLTKPTTGQKFFQAISAILNEVI
jgi:hypothetical protein